MFPTDQARFDAFLTNVGNEVSRTSQFLANYIPSKLVILNLIQNI